MAPTKVRKPDIGAISPIKKHAKDGEDEQTSDRYQSSDDDDDGQIDGEELSGISLFTSKSKSPNKGLAKQNTESLFALQVADSFKNKEEKEEDAKFRAEVAKAQGDAGKIVVYLYVCMCVCMG